MHLADDNLKNTLQSQFKCEHWEFFSSYQLNINCFLLNFQAVEIFSLHMCLLVFQADSEDNNQHENTATSCFAVYYAMR